MRVNFDKKIIRLIKNYYENRDLQIYQKWDKEKDVKAILTAGVAKKFCTEVCCGSFWFTNKNYIYYVDGDSFPQAERTKIKKKPSK